MKNLFIDSNIWLSLYHFTVDDLREFEKLKNFIGTEIKLYLPRQVYDEILRNRESKLKDSLKNFEIKMFQYPVFCKEYEEYKQVRDMYSELQKQIKLWRDKIDNDIKDRNLPADKTIRVIFEKIELLDCYSLVERAYTRFKIGNPPGKDSKYGDSINWECLLDHVPEGEDIYLISADKDYASELFDDSFNPFLLNEWKEKKKSNLYFFKNLVAFLKEHLKEIELKSENEKQNLIDTLAHSESFYSTHKIIADLSKHSGWTISQIEALCAIAKENTQVSWILNDHDVFEFYFKLLSNLPGDLKTQDYPYIYKVMEKLELFLESDRIDALADMADAIEGYNMH